SASGHALYAVVPASLDRHEYTPFQQRIRPFELLLLAGAIWWSLNRASHRDESGGITTCSTGSDVYFNLEGLMRFAKTFGVGTVCLLIAVTMLSVLEPEGLGGTLAMAGTGLGIGATTYLLLRSAERQRLTTILGENRCCR